MFVSLEKIAFWVTFVERTINVHPLNVKTLKYSDAKFNKINGQFYSKTKLNNKSKHLINKTFLNHLQY